MQHFTLLCNTAVSLQVFEQGRLLGGNNIRVTEKKKKKIVFVILYEYKFWLLLARLGLPQGTRDVNMT